MTKPIHSERPGRPTTTVRVKRAYEHADGTDGYRVLIDRLWPRGLRKQDARLDAWLRALAPSDELRRWFGHDPLRFPDFRVRYRRELRNPAARELLDDLARRAERERVTLIYSAKDTEHNNALVLALEVARRLRRASGAMQTGRTNRPHAARAG